MEFTTTDAQAFAYTMPSTDYYNMTDDEMLAMEREAEAYALKIDELMMYETYPELVGDEYADAVLSTMA